MSTARSMAAGVASIRPPNCAIDAVDAWRDAEPAAAHLDSTLGVGNVSLCPPVNTSVTSRVVTATSREVVS